MMVNRKQEIEELLEIICDADFSSANPVTRETVSHERANQLREQADG